MQLTVAERILLLNVLPPAEGPLMFLRAVRTFREALGFSDEEVVELNLRCERPTPQQQHWSWDEGKNPEKGIEVGALAAKYLSDCIQASDCLKEEHLDFYGRFLTEEK